jgi:hypothetical protein
MIGRALAVLAVLGMGASPASAQRFIVADASVGGAFTAVGPAGGLYLDGSKAVLRSTSVVGELQLFQSTTTEVAVFGGVRQQLFHSLRGDIYAQLLFGVAAGYSQRCDLCHPRTTEFGLGANIALDDRWAVRVRGDVRVGGSAADLFYPTLGVGITRRW